MKRILFIAKNIPIPKRRNNKIIFTIAERLSEKVDITFFYPNEFVPWGIHFFKKYTPFYQLQSWKRDRFSIFPVSYKRLPFNNFAFALFNKLSQQAISTFQKHGEFDLIHAHYILPDGYFAYLYHQAFGTPYVISIRKSDIQYLKNITPTSSDFQKIKQTILHAEALLTLNLAQKQYIDQLFNVTCELMPHGIESSALLHELPPKNDDVVHISVIGEAIGLKNIEWTIEAVKNYNGNQKIQLHIAGDGPLLEKYKTLSSDNKNIHVYGRVPREKVLELMTQSEIFALPSDNESFGLVYLEAAARQNAIIGYVEQGVWGVFNNDEMLFAQDYASFEGLLFKLIETPQLRTKMSANAFKKAEVLTWEKVSENYMQVYRKALE